MTKRVAVITGASTGIGRACALHLDALGWTVYAGVRKDADGESLANLASQRLVPVKLDVTDQTQIEDVAGRIENEAGGELAGLVNNAGITVQGPLEYLPIDELRSQLEVNVTGQIAVTQSMLPAIRKAGGRIVFMSSIAGRSEALPLIGPYSASKRALEALAEALRAELFPWGIRVALIEPGSIATPIWEKGEATFDDLIEALPDEGRARYEKALQRGRKIASMTGNRGIAPEKVAVKVAHALTSSRPRFRYLVGADAKARAWLEPAVPTFVRDRSMGRMLGYGSRGSDRRK